NSVFVSVIREGISVSVQCVSQNYAGSAAQSYPRVHHKVRSIEIVSINLVRPHTPRSAAAVSSVKHEVLIDERVMSENQSASIRGIRCRCSAETCSSKRAILDVNALTAAKMRRVLPTAVPVIHAAPILVKYQHAHLSVWLVEIAMVNHAPYAAGHLNTTRGRMIERDVIYAHRMRAAVNVYRSLVIALCILRHTAHLESRHSEIARNARATHHDRGLAAPLLWHVIVNDCHALSGTGESNILRDVNLPIPRKRSRRERDRIAVLRLAIVQILHALRCAVGMVNGRLAV